MKDLEWALITQALSGTMVQRANVGSQLIIRKNRQVGVLGQVLSQQAVGVLIGAAFPGVVRMGEEYLHKQPALLLSLRGQSSKPRQRHWFSRSSLPVMPKNPVTLIFCSSDTLKKFKIVAYSGIES